MTEWKDPTALAALAAAEAECGRFTQAIKWQTQALEMIPEELKAELREQLEAYRAGRPYRERLHE